MKIAKSLNKTSLSYWKNVGIFTNNKGQENSEWKYEVVALHCPKYKRKNCYLVHILTYINHINILMHLFIVEIFATHLLLWFLNLFQSLSPALARTRTTNCWVKIFWYVLIATKITSCFCALSCELLNLDDCSKECWSPNKSIPWSSRNFLFIVVFSRFFKQLSVKWQIKN